MDIKAWLDGCRELQMKSLALAAIVIAGCATSPATASRPDPSFDLLGQQSWKIEEHENWCINETIRQNDKEFPQIGGTPDSFTALEIQRLTDERDRAIYQCQASADRQRDALSSQDRAEYQARAQEERDHSDLVMILTASGPR
jgi:uncharacterized protein with LGFP repeats